jgi:hypothetical protein
MNAKSLIDSQLHESFDIRGNNRKRISFSSWEWRPLKLLCSQAGALNGLDINFDQWDFNDGHGLENQEKCNELADALEDLIRRMGPRDAFKMPGVGRWVNSYSIDRESVNRFIQFLRECGGFSIM